jgi:hypothetical protein
MVNSDTESEYKNQDIDNLVTQTRDLSLLDKNFMNIKPNPTIKTGVQWNPNMTDIPSTSYETTKTLGFDKFATRYAGIRSTIKYDRTCTP